MIFLEAAVFGVLASLLSAVFFGLYPVPRRYVDFGINDYLISMTLGVLICGLALSTFSSFSILYLSGEKWILGLITGSLWALGTVLYVSSVDCSGVGRATPIKNITAAVGLALGLIVFREIQGLTWLKTVYIIIGTFLIIWAGKILGSIQGKVDISRPSCPVDLAIPRFFTEDLKTPMTAGFILALGAAVLYGFTSIPLKMLTARTGSVFQFLPSVGLGALITSVLADTAFTTTHTWRKVPVKEHFFAVLGGFIWVFGLLFLSTGIKLVKLSVAWPIAMSSTVFAILYALIAKEIKFGSNKKEVLKGLSIGVFGIFLLGMSL